MSEQTSNTRKAETLTVGDHISDHQGVHELVHVLPFHDGDGSPMLALTLRPLLSGQPWIARHAEDTQVHLATPEEIRDAEEHGRARELAATLGQLADTIVDNRLPTGRVTGDLTLFLDDNDDVARWAKALDVEVTETSSGWPKAKKELPGLSVAVYGKQPSRAGA